MMTPKRNSCVTLAFSNTHLKMYGKGTKIDEIRESTTIDASFDNSRVIVVIALRFLEHVWHTIDYFVKKPGDEDVKPPRRNRSNWQFYQETRGLPWCVDAWNWHNRLALQLNRQLRNVIGTKWNSFFRGGRTVKMAVLDSNPLTVLHPKHYCEWETKNSCVRSCVHPNADTFASYYLEPVKNLLGTIE